MVIWDAWQEGQLAMLWVRLSNWMLTGQIENPALTLVADVLDLSGCDGAADVGHGSSVQKLYKLKMYQIVRLIH